MDHHIIDKKCLFILKCQLCHTSNKAYVNIDIASIQRVRNRKGYICTLVPFLSKLSASVMYTFMPSKYYALAFVLNARKNGFFH